MWRGLSSTLATKAALFARKLSLDPICSLCQCFPETLEHILFACPWARKTWMFHPIGYRPQLQQLTTFDTWFYQLSFPVSTEKSQQQEVMSHISFLLWYIWKHRCHCVFNYSTPDSRLVASTAFDASLEFLSSKKKMVTQSVKSSLRSRPPPKPKWIPPLPQQLKINSDASWTSQSVGVAAIARDSTGHVVGGVHSFSSAPTPLYAEALALLAATNLAHSLIDQHIQVDSFLFESDSFQLVDLLNNSGPSSDWAVMPLIDYIRDRTVALPSYSWTWSSRLANQAADHLACLARRRMCPDDWWIHPPSSLSYFLLLDAVSTPDFISV
ncbi:uncharacterized protein LOC133710609 [Rosa rugosa]|nr:uncharacterized protein LOC133710609 [Rosa rugosa]